MFRRSREILTLEQKVKALEMYDKKKQFSHGWRGIWCEQRSTGIYINKNK